MSSISADCLSAIQSGLTTGHFQQCANIIGLASLTTVTGSIVAPLNDYLTGFCPSPACSQDTLANASAVISNACSSDDSDAYGAILPILVTNFAGIKAAACIQQTSNSSYCLPQLLKGIEDATGIQLNTSTIEGFVNGALEGQMPSIPPSVSCTDCGSALVYELFNIGAGLNLTTADIDDAQNSTQQDCPNYQNFGAALPRGITTTDGSSTSVSIGHLD